MTFSSRTQLQGGLADRVRQTVVGETDLLNVLNLFKDRGRYIRVLGASRSSRASASLNDQFHAFLFSLQLSSLILWIICAEPNPIGGFFRHMRQPARCRNTKGSSIELTSRLEELFGDCKASQITDVSHAQRFVHIKTVVMVAGC